MSEEMLMKMIAEQESKTAAKRKAEEAKKQASLLPKDEFDDLNSEMNSVSININVDETAFFEIEAQSNYKRMLELKERGVKYYQGLVAAS